MGQFDERAATVAGVGGTVHEGQGGDVEFGKASQGRAAGRGERRCREEVFGGHGGPDRIVGAGGVIGALAGEQVAAEERLGRLVVEKAGLPRVGHMGGVDPPEPVCACVEDLAVGQWSRGPVGEIVEVLPLAQSTVSQHLKELLRAGLITGSVDGPKSCYCINWKTFEQFEKQFNEFFTKTNSNNPKCC